MATPSTLAALITPTGPGPALIGITGSVAAGKSMLATQLAAALAPTHSTATLSTDGFLHPNAHLDAHGLTLRKGYPESYDTTALTTALKSLRSGPITASRHSHITYDIDPDTPQTVGPAQVILIEGLALGPRNAALLDHLIYIDASETDLEHWFTTRFMTLWHAAETDPTSFYTRFRTLDAASAEVFAQSVWTSINLPNLRDHIAKAKPAATILLEKSADHSLRLIRPASVP